MRRNKVRMFGVSDLFRNFVAYSIMATLNTLQDKKYGTR